MARPRPRWPMIALAAVLAVATLGFLGMWRSQRLAGEHASRAQRALDEANNEYQTIKFISEGLKKVRAPSDKARYEAILKTSRRRLGRLEETAARHERMARDYGYQGPFKRAEPAPKKP